MAHLSFEPLIPGSLWLALAAAGAALLAWYALRRPEVMRRQRWAGVVTLMTVAIALVLLVLLNPTWVRPIPPPAGKPLVTVLVDATASMTTTDAAGGASRFASAAEMAKAISSRLRDRYEVQIRTFGSGLAPVDAAQLANMQPSGQSTDLATAIGNALGEGRPQGQALVLLSDGIHNMPGGVGPVFDAARVARAAAAPVYTRTFGRDVAGLDLALELATPQDLAFPRQKAPIVARVRYFGANSGQTKVMLIQDGKTIGQQALTLSGSGVAEARFWAGQDKVGLYPYEVKVEPLPGELTTANNSAPYLLRVVDKPIRLLLLEGKPYWDTKFLMRTLAAAPAIELDAIVRVADGRLVRRTLMRADPNATTRPTGPATTQPGDEKVEKWEVLNKATEPLARLDALKTYQIVVLGRDAEAFLTDATIANLQQWVRRDGGALVCFRGAPTAAASDKLRRLLPVKWTPGRETHFQMRITDEGQKLHWLAEQEMLRNLPPLARSEQVDPTQPLARILATASDSSGRENPVVIANRDGAGNVVVVEGAGMWRWAFLPPQSQQKEDAYAGLWNSMLRWLISGASLLPGQDMAIRTEAMTFGTEENVVVMILTRTRTGGDAAPVVPSVQLNGGGMNRTEAATPIVDAPGSYRVSFGKLPEGRYTARIAGAKADDPASACVFDVRNASDEMLNLSANPQLMARVSAETGGAVLDDASAEEIARRFEGHLNQVRPPAVQRICAWDRWWILAAVLALWTVSWFARRSGGLV